MAYLKGGLIILKEMFEQLPPSEKKIAQYIIQQPQEAIVLTTSELAKKSDTSSAAVIRLCKSLGFSGFQELKLRVAGDIQQQSVVDYRDIEPNENCQAIIDKVTTNTIRTLKETKDILNIQDIERAAIALTKAESIVFVGNGASYIAASDAEQKFLRINKNVNSYSDVHMGATAIANKGPNDVVVGISFSGETYEVSKLLQLAKQNDVTTISITRYGPSPVANNADICLYTSATREATFRSAATSSRIAQLHIIDILFMSVASMQYERVIKYLDTTREAITFIKEDKT